MHCIKEYNWLEKTKVVVEEYDNKVLIPMLMKVFKLLNPCWNAPPLEPKFPHDLFFEVLASHEKISESLLKLKVVFCIVTLMHMFRTRCFLYCGGGNMKIDFQMLDFLLDKYWAFLVHKLRWNVSSTFVTWSQAWDYDKLVWEILAC